MNNRKAFLFVSAGSNSVKVKDLRCIGMVVRSPL